MRWDFVLDSVCFLIIADKLEKAEVATKEVEGQIRQLKGWFHFT